MASEHHSEGHGQAKRLFIAATKQDQGKTTISLGLMAAFGELCPPVGFIKPVGQRYIEVDGLRVDEDAALMRSAFNLQCDLADTSPVTVARSFTRDYILRPRPDVLMGRIRESFGRVAAGAATVVIEGTGHAGVGSCFDASNADVARLLGAKVILVASGGIGKPIDEVMLNKGLLDQRGVDLLGVVLNKVIPDKLDSITEFVRAGLGRLGVRLLGSIPFEPTLLNPTLRQVLREVRGELLHGPDLLDRPIRSVVVGAMAAANALPYIKPGCLLITSGDREDLILAITSLTAAATDPRQVPAGLLLTGGLRPPASIEAFIRRANVPTILSTEDTYRVATDVDELRVKIQPEDTAKIETACRLVRTHLDIQQLLDAM
ncbi:MAG: AAA family ATPase [Planctomycetes bacterium]|nr:AAA family ATPase [Planctomycetota bacterium]